MDRRNVLRMFALAGVAGMLAACDKAPHFNNVDITGVDYGKALQLPDFDGKPRTMADFAGKVVAVFFGYTHCPDVCPTTLAEMAGWYEQLGPDADKLNAFFVTVDPERDTPAIINDYVHAVSDRVTGITGSRPEIDKMLAAWKVYSEKVPGEDGDYVMNHTASVFLINSKGEFEGTIAYGESQDVAVQKLKKLIAEG